MKRTVDGRAQLKRKNGTWMSVRLDMEVPGAILLRDTKTNGVYALETDQLPQVGCHHSRRQISVTLDQKSCLQPSLLPVAD